MFSRPSEPTTDSLASIPLVDATSNHSRFWLPKSSRVTSTSKSAFRAALSTEDPAPHWQFRDAATDQVLPRTEYVRIDDLGDAGYQVRQPVPAEIRRLGFGDFEASFREANIAISGSDRNDAFQALVAEILDTLDLLLMEPSLSPDAAEQLRILRTYIVKT